MTTEQSHGLLHLLRLVSPALPVGAYAYSQGLETAVENNWVQDCASAENWLRASLEHNLAYLDAPVFQRLYKAWSSRDWERVNYWNNFLLASRESAELLLEDTQMGDALLRLLNDLSVDAAKHWKNDGDVSFVSVFALATQQWQVESEAAVRGLLWAWLENQVAAAIKLVPLGQTQGQKLLMALTPAIDRVAKQCQAVDDAELGWSLPRMVMGSMQHETQYSRLFRS